MPADNSVYFSSLAKMKTSKLASSETNKVQTFRHSDVLEKKFKAYGHPESKKNIDHQ